MQPVTYDTASAEVRAVFDDIKATRKVADVNNFWNISPTIRACCAMSGKA